MSDNELTTREESRALPPILASRATPAVVEQVHRFYSSVAEIFEAWVARCRSPHTRRAYRGDVMALVAFLELHWPDDATRLLEVSVTDVQRFREQLIEQDRAPKTIVRRIASVSSFYKYLSAAAEL